MLVFLVGGIKEELGLKHSQRGSSDGERGRKIHVMHESYGNNFEKISVPRPLNASVPEI